jgi:hypothetical protein
MLGEDHRIHKGSFATLTDHFATPVCDAVRRLRRAEGDRGVGAIPGPYVANFERGMLPSRQWCRKTGRIMSQNWPSTPTGDA